MAKFKREAKGKQIKPVYYVFCEGESEESYVLYLRAKYRIPVEILPKILRNQISERKIRESIKKSPHHEKDKIYLMYDIDVEGFLEKLKEIKKKIKSELILSNPCFELWFLYHFSNQSAEINSAECVKKLNDLCPSYKKGNLSFKLKEKLLEKNHEAIKRAKSHELHKNPSTNVYLFLEEIENLKK